MTKADLPSWDEAVDGRFPFGLPNTPRPVREPKSGRMLQLVLGVYPSALHVAWTRPASRDLPARRRRVASMAVDVEPTVFWDGADAAARVEDWAARVGFRAGDTVADHGILRPATNGPSGTTLTDYFSGLPVGREDSAFADVYPVYLVKRQGVKASPASDGKRSARQQGDAIDEVYDSSFLGLAPGPDGPWARSSLPSRLRPDVLPHRAAERFGDWLLQLLRTPGLESIVTLGQEPWTTLDLLDGVVVDAPAESLSAMRSSGYGVPGSLSLDGREIAWFPLAHPGLLRQSDVEKPGSWAAVHRAWQST
jgi:hypothetical protein